MDTDWLISVTGGLLVKKQPRQKDNRLALLSQIRSFTEPGLQNQSALRMTGGFYTPWRHQFSNYRYSSPEREFSVKRFRLQDH